MIVKTPILPQRIRQIPKSFSWIDHRLVRDRHIERCSHAAAALYLFLVCVGDHRGLSYYGDKALCQRLDMTPAILEKARGELIRCHLLAWRSPIYQVLSLESVKTEKRPASALMNLGTILKQAREAAHD